MRRGGPNARPQNKRDDRTRVNHQIRVPKVRLVGSDGEQIGVINTREALSMAEEQELDLVEVAPNATPPVCRLMDYGRYRYEQQKKARQKAKTSGGEQKELQMRPSIEKHDYETKLRHAKDFLSSGNRVKLTVRFRGRELAHRELGRELLLRFAGDLGDTARTEGSVFDEGRNVSLKLIPGKSS